MGRWAQAHRRGSVTPGETRTAPAIPAPINDVDWDAVWFNGGTFTVELAASIAGTIGIGFRYSTVSAAGPWTVSGSVILGAGSVNEIVGGSHAAFYVQAVWLGVSFVQVSAYSATYTAAEG